MNNIKLLNRQMSWGEKKIKDINKPILIELKNTPINKETTLNFFRFIHKRPAKVEFVKNLRNGYLGLAWLRENKIQLKSHTVSTFLHEFAHILDYRYRKSYKQCHGLNFSRRLDYLIDKWIEFI
jgi:hypothetical protein